MNDVKECLRCPIPCEGLKTVLRHIDTVQDEGYGDVTINIKEGNIVSSYYGIGEQIRMDLDALKESIARNFFRVSEGAEISLKFKKGKIISRYQVGEQIRMAV